ncbi:hypothetical protein F4814DRAFT_456901 [Daldinia grandis]|nr:hypothetical protein F4814DRAFT_456901 [Daldinia grandis]
MELHHDHGRAFKVPVSTQLQEPWSDTLKRIIPLFQCIHECNSNSQYHPKHRASIHGYAGDNFKPVSMSHVRRTCYSWRQTLESQSPKKKPLFTDEYNECGPTTGVICTKQSHKATATPSSPTKRRKRAVGLLDLPCEVFEYIFEYAVGSYELRGDLLRLCRHTYNIQCSQNISTQLILYKPRAWAELNVFQICRAFRNLAISYYGSPQENSFPFSPKLDTIVIHGEGLGYSGEEMTSSGVSYSPNLHLQDWDNDDHWLYYDGVYRFNENMCDVRPWSKVIKTSNKCLRRATEITIDIHDGSTYKTHWKDIWYFLGRTFTNTACLRFNVSQADCCARMKPGMDLGAKKYYLSHDIKILHELGFAIEESPPNRLFPKLEALKLVRVVDYCTGIWSQENRGTRRLFGIKLAR